MGHIKTGATVTSLGHMKTGAAVTPLGHMKTGAAVTSLGHMKTGAAVTSLGHIKPGAAVASLGHMKTGAAYGNRLRKHALLHPELGFATMHRRDQKSRPPLAQRSSVPRAPAPKNLKPPP